MAWALQFDGVNDYAQFTAVNRSDASWRIEFRLARDLAGNADTRFLGQTSNANDYINVENTASADSVRYRVDGSNVDFLSTPMVTDDLDYHTYIITDDGTDLTLQIDSNTPVTNLGAGGKAFKDFESFGRSAGNYYEHRLEYFRYYDTSSGDTLIYNWDATSSFHGAGATTLLDIASSNDANGFNFPTDGSQWIDLGGGITVTVQDISQSQALDNIDLTQKSVLTLNELNQIQTVENVNLVSGSQLSIDELSQLQTIDNVDLTQGYSVSLNDISQGQTLESILLTQNNNLTIEELTQLQAIDNLTLVTGDQILVNRLDQMQTLDNVEISQAGVILLNRVDQFQFIEQIDLQALTPVTVQSLSQAQQLENITVTQLATLVQLNDATQNQTIDNINLLQTSIIQIGRAHV